MLPLIKTAVAVLLVVVAGCSGTRGTEFGPSSSLTTQPGVALRPSTQPGSRAISPSPSIVGAPVSTPEHEITLDEVRQHIRGNSAVLVDSREETDFRRGHVRGAISFPVSQLDRRIADVRQRVASNELVIIYCAGMECDSSDTVYQFFLSHGYTNVRVFKPGWAVLGKASDLH